MDANSRAGKKRPTVAHKQAISGRPVSSAMGRATGASTNRKAGTSSTAVQRGTKSIDLVNDQRHTSWSSIAINNATDNAYGVPQQVHSNYQTIINAPTSLTNLAQLSGISFTPIATGSSGRRVEHVGRPGTVKQIGITQISSGNAAPNKGPRQTSKINQKPKQQNLPNVTAIPSIRFINQASTSLSDVSGFNNSLASQATAINSMNNPSQGLCITQFNNLANHANPIYSMPNSYQVIPLTDSMGLPVFLNNMQSDPQRMETTTQETTSQDSIPISRLSDTTEQDNISLLKLLAVLNNPALTITAVDPSAKDKNIPQPISRARNEPQHPAQSIINLPGNQSLSITLTDPPIMPMYESESNDYIKKHVTQSMKKVKKNNQRKSQAASNDQQRSSFEEQMHDSIDDRVFAQDLEWFESSDCGNDHEKATGRKKKKASIKSDNGSGNTNQAESTFSFPHVNDTEPISHNPQRLHDSNSLIDPSSSELLEADPIRNNMNRMPRSFLEPAKQQEKTIAVCIGTRQCKNSQKSKHGKHSKDRLYIPTRARRSSPIPTNLGEIQIVELDEQEFCVSEQLDLLERMRQDRKLEVLYSLLDPDDIFIDRSKRVMSKIDSMIERKKRRRFKRIASREQPKPDCLEDLCAESEDEWSNDENVSSAQDCFIRTQLPLQETLSESKKVHLASVGLISRQERNDIYVKRCEAKFSMSSPLSTELTDAQDNFRDFTSMVLNYDLKHLQLTTESNIKRNTLPAIEGLNRNSGRAKLSYMYGLGLDKKSKRTTIYALNKFKPSESSGKSQHRSIDDHVAQTTATRKDDLNPTNKIAESANEQEPPNRSYGSVYSNYIESLSNTAKSTTNSINVAMGGSKACRVFMRPLDKREFMKSLGLMAS